MVKKMFMSIASNFSGGMKVFLAIIFIAGCIAAHANPSGTVIYSQDFDGTHGWTLNVPTGEQGADPNFWVVSDNEGGVLPPGCAVASNSDKTLHITSVFNPSGGAAYDAGGLCGILFCPQANSRAESPAFSTVGYSNINLSFDYIAGGEGLNDNASVWINTGSGWTPLLPSIKSPVCGAGQGKWANYNVTLPASAENNPSVKIAFGWVNNDDGVGTDPSVAINNVKVSVSGGNIAPSYTLSSPQALTICRDGAGEDISSLLHVNDADAGQTETFTQQSAPSHGYLVFTGATASSGSSNIAPAGTIVYNPVAGYSGPDAFTIRVSDGTATTDMVVNVTVTGPSVSINTTNVSCNGGSNGTASAMVAGGIAPYTYVWNNGQINQTITGLTPYTYHVDVVDAHGCTGGASTTITQPTPLAATATTTDVTTYNGTDGSATVSVTGGVSPYSYSWTSGANTATATGLAAGSYIVIVSDANFCQTTATATISQPAPCAEWNDITSDLNVNSNSYLTAGMASDTAGNLFVSYLDPVLYKLKVKKFDGASWHDVGAAVSDSTYFVQSITVDRTGVPYVALKEDGYLVDTPLERIIVRKFDGTNWVTVGSTHYFRMTGEYGYIKVITAPDGTPYISYPDDEHENVPIIQKLVDNEWVTIPLSTSVDIIPLPIATDAFGNLFAGYGNNVMKYNGSGWNNIGGSVFSSSNGAIRQLQIDGNGNPIVLYNSLQQVKVARYDGSWSDLGTVGNSASATFSDLLVDNTGKIFVSIKDASTSNKATVYTYNGSAWVAVIGQGVSATAVNMTCLANGIDNKPALGYLSTSAILNVRQFLSSTPSIVLSNTDTVVQGNTSTALPYSSPLMSPVKYSVVWNSAATLDGFTNAADVTLGAGAITLSVPATAALGTYNGKIVVKNTDGCKGDSLSFSIEVVPSNITPVFTLSSPQALTLCRNAAATDIKALLHVSDADTAQTLTWTQQAGPAHGTLVVIGATASSGTTNITPAGTITYQPTTGYGGPDAFTIRVSDGVSSSDMVVNVTVDNITVSVTPTNVTCNGANNGSATATATGGTAPYTYIWSNGHPTQSITGLPAGVYHVWATDANSCEAEIVDTITEPALLTATIAGTTTICNGAATTITITSVPDANVGYTVDGGTVQYLELNASGVGTINTGSVTATKIYALVNTSNGLCTNAVSGSATISTFAIPTADTVASQVLCDGANIDVVTFTGTADDYAWSNNNTTTGLAASGTGNIAAFTATNTTAAVTVSTVTVTPKSGTCSGSPVTFTISVKPTPTVAGTPDGVACNGDIVSSVEFTGNIGTTVYNWTNTDASVGLAAAGAGSVPGFTAVNATNATRVAGIVVTPVNNGCTGASDTFSIAVYPTPDVAATADQVVCNSLPTTAVHFTGSVASTVFSWHNNNTGIGLEATNTTDIASFTAINTGSEPVMATITVLPTANGCEGQRDTFTITVNPTPQSDALVNQGRCDGAATAAITFFGATTGTTYSWSNSNSSIGLASTGTGNIASFTAVNTGTVTETATVTVAQQANGCAGADLTMTYTVYPTPHMTPIADQSLCNGANTTAITFGSSVSGSSFAWTNTNALIGLALFGNTYGIPSFPAANTGTSTLVSTIVVTPTANGCTGTTDTFSYIVTPTPTVNAIGSQVLCNTDTTLVVSFTGAVAGTVYSWTNTNTTVGLAATGTGDIASFTAVNAGNVFDTATITVTPSVGACLGATQNFDVIVKPTPTVDAVSNQVLCNDAATTDVTFTGAVAGTANNWVNTNTNIGLAASGVGNILSFAATNTTVAPISGTVTVTPLANGCTGASQSFTYTVNPTPKLSTAQTGTVCSGTLYTYAPASATTGVSYAWARAAAAGISNAAGNATGSIGETLYNTTLAPKVATYNYTLTANGCSNQQNLLVTVNPTPQAPVITITAPANVCSQTMNMNFGAATAQPDTVQYTWTAAGATVLAQGAGHQNAIVSFPEAGNAIVVLTANATGFTCTSKDTFAVAVSNSVANNAEVYYIHDHFIYTDNTVGTYQWGYDDATTLDSVIYTGQVDQNLYEPTPDFTNRKYWVMTTKDGCMSKNYYNAPTGVVNVNSAVFVNLTVVPNPASNYVSVGIDGISGSNDKVELTDLTGKTVITEAVLDNKAQLDVNNLASGVYLVTYYHNGVKAGTAKLVKE
jgi:hypothetical protein